MLARVTVDTANEEAAAETGIAAAIEAVAIGAVAIGAVAIGAVTAVVGATGAARAVGVASAGVGTTATFVATGSVAATCSSWNMTPNKSPSLFDIVHFPLASENRAEQAHVSQHANGAHCDRRNEAE